MKLSAFSILSFGLLTALSLTGTSTWAQEKSENKNESRTSESLAKAYTVKVDFSWDPVPDAMAYEVEFKNEKFQRIFSSKKAELNVQVPPGFYKMKLRALDQRGVPGDWSDPSDIEAWPQVIALSSEHDRKGTPVPGTTKAQVKLEWPSLPMNPIYQVTIKDSKKKALQTLDSNTPEIQIPLSPGEYTFNVIAKFEGGFKTKPSPYEPVIEIPRKKLIAPEWLDKNSPLKDRRLTWKPMDDVLIVAEIEYAHFGGTTWRRFDVTDALNKNDLDVSALKKPGKFRVKIKATAEGWIDSDAIAHEFIIKPLEKDLL